MKSMSVRRGPRPSKRLPIETLRLGAGVRFACKREGLAKCGPGAYVASRPKGESRSRTLFSTILNWNWRRISGGVRFQGGCRDKILARTMA